MSPAVASFLDVLLRGIALCAQATAVGGVVFALWVLGDDEGLGFSRRRRALVLVAAGAGVLAAIQALLLALQLHTLAEGGPWPAAQAFATPYFRAGAIRCVAASALALVATAGRRGPRTAGRVALLGLCLALAVSSAAISHAAGRLEHRGLLLLLDAIHQAAGAVWLGGLVHLIGAAFRRGACPWPASAIRRFSAVATVAVVVLVGAGAGLSAFYVGSVGGLIGTSYGAMVLTKVVLLGGLLALGSVNFLAVRRLDATGLVSLARVRWFIEVEMGLGLTVLFASASLTSLPPAIDIVADRATAAEVTTRFTPRWPTFTSPALADMPIDDREAPRTAADRAWSEYNHHMAGLIVLVMGLLATANALAGAEWARHWPLVFLALAAFIVVRADPGAWPLAGVGFWESMRFPEVLQHRIFALLVILFGVFEWLVRTGRLRRPVYPFVFPLLCSVGGALLLTHSHALLDLKSEFLTEITHIPLGLLGLLVGWARWLELRLPAREARVPRRIWAAGITLAGLLLLIYRES